MLPMKRLRTNRLLLRPLVLEDAERFLEIWTNPEVAEFLLSRPGTIEQMNEVTENMIRIGKRWGMWGIVLYVKRTAV